MTLSFFITVIPDHDKPQPPGCLLDRNALRLPVLTLAIRGDGRVAQFCTVARQEFIETHCVYQS
ncbi:hypothetical protein FPX92_22915 [Salmonella enterica]|nr:hypothetical protein [Salmonella enterica]